MRPTSRLLLLSALAVGAYIAVKKGALQVAKVIVLEAREEIKRRRAGK